MDPLGAQTQGQEGGGAKAVRRMSSRKENEMIKDFDRSLVRERNEELQREVQMWHLEKQLRAIRERLFADRRGATLSGRSGARKEAAIGLTNQC